MSEGISTGFEFRQQIICVAQAVSLNKQAEELRSEIKALERSNKDIQSRRDQIEKQMQSW